MGYPSLPSAFTVWRPAVEGHIWSFAEDFRKQYSPRLVGGNSFQDWTKCGERVLLSILYFFLKQELCSVALADLEWACCVDPACLQLTDIYLLILVCLFVHLCVVEEGVVRAGPGIHVDGAQRTTCERQFSLSPAWVPRLDHRLSGLAIAPLPLVVLQTWTHWNCKLSLGDSRQDLDWVLRLWLKSSNWRINIHLVRIHNVWFCHEKSLPWPVSHVKSFQGEAENCHSSLWPSL